MKKNLSNDVLNTIRNEILLNRLHGGDVLSEVELCERFGVSRTPVRQALQKLASLGLIEIKDGSGTYVTMINPKDMHDAYQIRCSVEKLALETSINNITEDDLCLLEEKFLTFKEQLDNGGYGASFEDMIYTDWKLHDLILSKSDNKLLEDTVGSITLILRRYQFTFISLYSRANNEHLAIIKHIREKNLEAVKAVLDVHLSFRPLLGAE